MALRKGTITYNDGTTDKVVITSGDKIRAKRVAEDKKNEDIIAGATDEILLYQAYLAAKRNNLRSTDKPFLDWADEVAEFDQALTEEMVDTLLIDGQITEEQAERMRKYVDRDEEPTGESTATPTT